MQNRERKKGIRTEERATEVKTERGAERERERGAGGGGRRKRRELMFEDSSIRSIWTKLTVLANSRHIYKRK